MLRPLREIATFVPWMREIGLPAQFRVVVDANIVFSELIWLTGRRRDRDARTFLQEVVAAGTLRLIGPTWLDQEVRDHVEEIAAEAGVSVDECLLAWEAYRASITFVHPKSCELGSEIDPKDVPYLLVYREFGAQAVYSSDRHISQMGAVTIDKEVIVTLRDYSRAASWHFAIQYGGMTAAALSWHTLVASLRILVGIWRFVRSSPRWVQFALLAGGVALIAHPNSREWLAEMARSAGRSLRTVVSETGRLALQLGAQAILKEQEAHAALSKVKGHLQGKRVPLRLLVRALCVTKARPMSLEEIAHRVLANGYQTHARDFGAYLRRVLRESGDFTQTQSGWTYNPAEAL